MPLINFFRKRLNVKFGALVILVLFVLVGLYTVKTNQDEKDLMAAYEKMKVSETEVGISKTLQAQYTLLKVGLVPILSGEAIVDAFAARDRETLLKITEPFMKKFNAYGIDQFQFHLPDHTSFLRVHKPKQFGDDLTKIRPLVVQAINTQQVAFGLENGVAGIGFRYISPVVKDGEFIGTVELGLGLNSTMTARLQEQYPGEWYVFGLDGDKAVFLFGTADENYAIGLTESQIATAQTGKFFTFPSGKCVVYLSPILDSAGKSIGYFQGVYDNTVIVDQVDDQLRNNLIMGILVALVGVLFSSGTIYLLLKPLGKIKNELNALASNGGDLTQRLHVGSMDEVGQLGHAFNRFIETVQGIIQQVKATSGNVVTLSGKVAESAEANGNVARQVASATNTMAEGASQQNGHVSEILQQIKSSSDKVQEGFDNANGLVDLSKQSTEIATNGKDYMTEVIEQFTWVSKTVEFATESIQNLGKRSLEISSISNVITGIASQTNLLALNASIEAARAGEHGRGFSVVAEEIRKLSQSTGVAAKAITELIRDTQSETDVTVKTMETNLEKVNTQIGAIQKGGEALETIVGMVRRTENGALAIHDIYRQIQSKTEVISNSVLDISGVISSNAAFAEEVAASSQEQYASMEEIASRAADLAVLAESLQGEVSKFKSA